MELIKQLEIQLPPQEWDLLTKDYCFYCGRIVELETDPITDKLFPINPEDRSYHVCLAKQSCKGNRLTT
ncbi:MAG TPA: hypothetical protein VKA95_02575 [Nitrososphaeraceae archaeon]|nr:hypothetical protein [Nitrososphaeraceae archaeon]